MRLVYIAIGWTIGIFFASQLPNFAPSAWLIMAFGFGLLAYANRMRYGWRWLMISLVALSLGAWRYAGSPHTTDIAQYNQQGQIGISVIGEVIALPDMRDDRQQIRLNTIQVVRGDIVTETSGEILAVLPPNADVRYGDMLKVTGELLTPQTFDSFSYADFLARTGIYSVMEKTSVQVLSRGGGSPIIHTLADIRAFVDKTVISALPQPAAGLLIGILLGDERHIAPELRESFQITGTSHIIAVSGFNMVIVASVVQQLLMWLMPNRRWAVLWLALLVMGIYTALTGANAAILRAALMTSLLLIGKTLNRNTYVPASLAFVVMVMSLVTPTVFWDVSFQLSFAAVLGLSVFVTPLQRAFNSGVRQIFPQSAAQSLSNWLTEPLIVTLAAQITTTPIILANFGTFSLVAIPVNLLVIPVQSYLLILGILAVGISGIIPIIGQAFFWLAYLLLGWTIGIVRLFAQLPFADVEWRLDPRLALVLYICLIGVIMMTALQSRMWKGFIDTLQSKFMRSISFFGAIGALLIMGGGIISQPDGKLHVWFLTMGHNNAVLIQTAGGAHILVDGGSYPSQLLTALGDKLPFDDQNIEMLIITQPDDFDTRALLSVLDRYEVGITLWHGQESLSDVQIQLDERLRVSERVVVSDGYSAMLNDGTKIEILHPIKNAELSPDYDDNTLVIRLSYGDVSFLLTGDLSQEAQTEMLARSVYAPSTVMQLPKHAGARTLDSDFLAMVAPSAVVVHADPANRLGDPNKDTLSLIGEIPLWRTDEQGVIHFWTDGKKLWAQGTNQ